MIKKCFVKEKVIIISLVMLEAITSGIGYLFFDKVSTIIQILIIIAGFLWLGLLYMYIRKLKD